MPQLLSCWKSLFMAKTIGLGEVEWDFRTSFKDEVVFKVHYVRLKCNVCISPQMQCLGYGRAMPFWQAHLIFTHQNWLFINITSAWKYWFDFCCIWKINMVHSNTLDLTRVSWYSTHLQIEIYSTWNVVFEYKLTMLSKHGPCKHW